MTDGFVCINQIIIVYALARLNWKKPRIQKKGLYTVSEDGVEYRTEHEECMEHELKRIFNRHIAKCLDHLGDTIAPVQIASIKRSFRFLEEDVTTLLTQGEGYDEDEDRFNR